MKAELTPDSDKVNRGFVTYETSFVFLVGANSGCVVFQYAIHT